MFDPSSSRGISVRQVLPEARWRNGRDVRVTSCTTDCNACHPGDLFIPLADDVAQRRRDIQHALSRGAVGIVARGGDPPFPVATCVVDDIHTALGHVCQALAGFPSRQLHVVGITGSHGKTTTSHLISAVLGAGDFRTALLGSLACCDGLDCQAPPRGTPTAPMLAAWLGRSAVHGSTHAVMEISRQSLNESRIAGIALDMACVTNVATCAEQNDARARHAAMARIFAHLLPEGVAVLNADDDATNDMLADIDTPALTIGIQRPAEISAQVIEQSASDQTFLLSAGSDSIPVRTPLLGTHNVYNCLFAAAVGFGYGLDLATIARGLESIACVAGRLEPIQCGQPFGVFVDDAQEPDSLSKALRTLREVTRARLRCVFSPGDELDRFGRVRLGRVVDELADEAIVTRRLGADHAADAADATLDDVLVGFRRRGRVRSVANRRQAILHMLTSADEGDCVLIAGGTSAPTGLAPSWRIDDRDLARDYLYHGMTPTAGYRAAA
jgi:UDP-N-acetylmuramoyl-L-alanyl-D-glutamate--2,6-diaminopimelate ligase